MKPMDMAEALFGSDDDAIGKPEGSVDTSAMAAIAAHLAREDAGPAPATAPAAASAGRDENETRAGGVTLLGNQHTQYPTDYDPSVTADMTAVEQIVYNLADNAAKYACFDGSVLKLSLIHI